MCPYNTDSQHPLRWGTCQGLADFSVGDWSTIDQALRHRDRHQTLCHNGRGSTSNRFFNVVMTVGRCALHWHIDIAHSALIGFVNATTHPNVVGPNKDSFTQQGAKTDS
jgi:hypothetical protein